MDRAKFGKGATGSLAQVFTPRADWAFIPNEMPPDWQFAPELWPLLVDAKEALGTLNGIGQTLSDPQLLLRPLQSREALRSSSIEGTYVTPQQLLLYELDPREPRSSDDQMADWYEVFNYSKALERGCEMLQTLPICNRVIREMHSVLMRGVRGVNKSPGEFRRWQVQIGSSGRFVPAPPHEVPRLMDNLERYINSDDPRYDPLVRSYIIHYQLEAIHPFGDGNGRVGRALLALMIHRWLGHALPWLYMSAFYEEFKDEYIEGMFQVSASGDWTRWIEFCLRGTIAQAHDSIRRCSQFNELRSEYHKMIASASPRMHPLVDLLFTSPVITVASVAKTFRVHYNTAKSDVHRLADAGVVKEIAELRPKSFYAPAIMRVAYGEPALPSDGQAESYVAPDAATEPVQPFEQSQIVGVP